MQGKHTSLSLMMNGCLSLLWLTISLSTLCVTWTQPEVMLRTLIHTPWPSELNYAGCALLATGRQGLQHLIASFDELDSNLAVLYSIVGQSDHSKRALRKRADLPHTTSPESAGNLAGWLRRPGAQTIPAYIESCWP